MAAKPVFGFSTSLGLLLFVMPAAVSSAGGLPDPPPFDFNLLTPNAAYRMSSVQSPGSAHYFPTLKKIAAALALDNSATPVFGMPNGYHAGYLNRSLTITPGATVDLGTVALMPQADLVFANGFEAIP